MGGAANEARRIALQARVISLLVDVSIGVMGVNNGMDFLVSSVSSDKTELSSIKKVAADAMVNGIRWIDSDSRRLVASVVWVAQKREGKT